MKRIVILLFLVLLVVGCETAASRDKKKQEEELKKITEEINKNDVPEESKKWLIDNKTSSVITVFCMSTSKKCESLKELLTDIETNYKLKTYYFNFDEVKDEVKSVYKTTYTIDDYTGYLPYIMVVNKDKLTFTHTDTLDKTNLIDLLTQNKIIN